MTESMKSLHNASRSLTLRYTCSTSTHLWDNFGPSDGRAGYGDVVTRDAIEALDRVPDHTYFRAGVNRLCLECWT